jgi:hypothetical protein
LRERLQPRLAPCPDDGCECLLWTGHLNWKGYGCIYTGPVSVGGTGNVRQVHIVVWELENGPVPDGLVLDHVHARGCRHRHCANVAHLEPVTLGENNRRSKALITACPRGHPYDEANTYRHGTHRYCRACDREAHRRKAAAT